jgi:uncharacterized protein (DUF1800 family)
MNSPADTAQLAAMAAHRFGLGEAHLQNLGRDPRGWLLAQLGPADPQRGAALPDSVEGLRRFAARQRRPSPTALAASATTPMAEPMADPAEIALRETVQADVRARLATAATSTRPFAERLALFWANHFTVSLAKGSTRGLVGAFEREAIRPNIGAPFAQMLRAAVTHAAMLRYLDNDVSAGPRSRAVLRRAARSLAEGETRARQGGLNENLAREVLELHTLGAASVGTPQGYTQADVTALARVLTGWRVPLRQLAEDPGATQAVVFDANWHEPGPKTVLGRTYREGPQALDEVLADLARHPATARFIATKLARHFVADQPPPALVARLEARYLQSGGDLASLGRALVEAPEAWSPQPVKLKSPEEFVVSTARVLGLGEAAFERQPDAGIATLGQRVQAAPSPAGWPDRAEEWLGPDAVWKRVEWTTRVANRLGRRVDARALAVASLGPRLSEDTARQIERAADGPQALALLLLAPEFQRR